MTKALNRVFAFAVSCFLVVAICVMAVSYWVKTLWDKDEDQQQ